MTEFLQNPNISSETAVNVTVQAMEHNKAYLDAQNGPDLAAHLLNLDYAINHNPTLFTSFSPNTNPDRWSIAANCALEQHPDKPLLSYTDLTNNPEAYGLSTHDISTLRDWIVMNREAIRSHERSIDASKDYLTGIDNRQSWTEKTIKLLEQFMRLDGPDNYFVLGMIDVDHFKEVNDKYGHPAGDRVLGKFGKRFQKKLRGVDIPGKYGGDEFAFSGLSGHTNPEEIQTRFEGIRQEITKPILVDNNELAITQSWGLVICTDQELATLMTDSPLKTSDGDYYSELLKKIIKIADITLYQAKEAGRNCLRSNHNPITT